MLWFLQPPVFRKEICFITVTKFVSKFVTKQTTKNVVWFKTGLVKKKNCIKRKNELFCGNNIFFVVTAISGVVFYSKQSNLKPRRLFKMVDL